MLTTYNFSVVIGNDRILKVTARKKQDGVLSLLDLTGMKIRCTVFTSKIDRQVLFQKKNTLDGGNDGQVLVTDAVNGKFNVYLDSASTSLLVDDVHHPWVIDLINGSIVQTLVYGLIFGVRV